MMDKAPLLTVPLDQRIIITVQARSFRGFYAPSFAERERHAASAHSERLGYALTITNNEGSTRSYRLVLAIMPDGFTKTAKALATAPCSYIQRHVANVAAGESVTVEVELEATKDFPNIYLVEFDILKDSTTPVAHFVLSHSLAAAAPTLDKPLFRSYKIFTLFINAELFLFALLISTVHSMHYTTSPFYSWLIGGALFCGGRWLFHQPYSKAFLCGLLCAVWGGLSLLFAPPLMALMVMIMLVFLHRYLGWPSSMAKTL